MTQLFPGQEYAQAIQFLYDRINYEQTPPASYPPRKLNLESMRQLLTRLGEPHLSVPIIHIAGTKGKGSTATMLSAVLTRAGYRTGLYTSPHLERLEDRYAIDGTRCDPAELVAMIHSIRPTVEEMEREMQSRSLQDGLTFFEITTAMAFQYFAQNETDIVVLEVGMGGRLDSTNVCSPLVSIITSISFDHTRQLGNTLAAIAREKAGIIKPRVPVISGILETEPREVIADVASSCDAPLFALGQHFDAVYARRHQSCEMTYREHSTSPESEWRLDDIQLGLLGRHQARNAAVTIASLRRLQEMGWTISDQAIRQGLETVQCPGRIEIVQRDPVVIVDTAHNVASIQSLVDTLNEEFPGGRRSLIFAASRDKDVPGMLRLLLPQFHEIFLTMFLQNPRAVPPDELADIVNQLISESRPIATAHVCPTPAEAWSRCRAMFSGLDLVCITGSFFLAAELRARLLEASVLPAS